MKKFVFLDVDGVLNQFGVDLPEDTPLIDRVMVKRLDRIINATDARVVISSSWRGMIHEGQMTLPGFAFMLHTHGFANWHTVIACTPGGSIGQRGSQIRRWVNANITWPPGDHARFVALDDMGDLGIVEHDIPLVLTNSRVGLTDANADEAIRILNGG